MRDLCPYVCTIEACSRPDEPFSTVDGYLNHEVMSHHLICSAEECSKSNEKFATVTDYLKHVVNIHKLDESALVSHLGRFRKEASVQCLFCGQVTAQGTGKDSRGKHVGRHMEEIAFLVVPKVYEDWDFYSDSSSILLDNR